MEFSEVNLGTLCPFYDSYQNSTLIFFPNFRSAVAYTVYGVLAYLLTLSKLKSKKKQSQESVIGIMHLKPVLDESEESNFVA